MRTRCRSGAAGVSGIGGVAWGSMQNRVLRSTVAGSFLLALSSAALAEDSGGWFSGNWYLKVGAAGFTAPNFDGDDTYELAFSPIISLGKAGDEPRFSSRNDSISLGIIDTGAIRAGPAGTRGELVGYPREHRGGSAVDLGGRARVQHEPLGAGREFGRDGAQPCLDVVGVEEQQVALNDALRGRARVGPLASDVACRSRRGPECGRAARRGDVPTCRGGRRGSPDRDHDLLQHA